MLLAVTVSRRIVSLGSCTRLIDNLITNIRMSSPQNIIRSIMSRSTLHNNSAPRKKRDAPRQQLTADD